ncbi:hypothetical protein [Rhodoferax ferrireducens]|uniref:hypothetical protein n=1 Tax=Rhodoferax ferrireducens TaxID=192843 RepID=UPI000E0D849F|nr:hypothetical protein [Rhodoferax ferrireducens]
MKVVFSQAGDFQAMQAAETWCKHHGISCGSGQGREPRGLLRGDFLIAKWRNLNKHERIALDGTMTGDMRNGPVTINIKGE